MKLLSINQLQSALTATRWASTFEGRIAIEPPAHCYETTFDANGIVGANVSETLLNEIMPAQVHSGLLQVLGGSPDSKEQTTVINYILTLSGQQPASIYDFRFEFLNDYSGLVAVTSWCLACGWEFDFAATTHRFGFRVGNNNLLSMFWKNGELTRASVPELLKNWECKIGHVGESEKGNGK